MSNLPTKTWVATIGYTDSNQADVDIHISAVSEEGANALVKTLLNRNQVLRKLVPVGKKKRKNADRKRRT